jgi:hypothetical protein
MSVRLLGRAFYADLPAPLRLLLLALADEAADDGTGVCIGQRRLAAKTGAAERTVRHNLARLRELGYVRRLEDLHPLYRTDQYEIVVDRLPSTTPADIAGASPAKTPEPEAHPLSPAQTSAVEASAATTPADIAGGSAAPAGSAAQAAGIAAPTGNIGRSDPLAPADTAAQTGNGLPPTRTTDLTPSEPSETDVSSGSRRRSLAVAPEHPAPRRRRPRDPVFETLAFLDGFDYQAPGGRRPNDDERGKLNRAARLVRQSIGDDIRSLNAAIRCWPEVMDDALCTARGVSTNIGRLVAAAEGRVFRAGAEGDKARLERELAATAAGEVPA